MLVLSIVWSEAAVDAADVDQMILAVQKVAMDDITEGELASAIEAGLWNEERTALAIAIPKSKRTFLFVLVEQSSGDYVAADVSPVEDALFRKISLAERAEYKSYKSSPYQWVHGNGSMQILLVRLVAWTKFGGYSVQGPVVVKDDGSIVWQ